jgi:ribonuclease PH
MSFKISFKIDKILSELPNEIPISSITAPFEEKLQNTFEDETPDNFILKETTLGEESASVLYKQGNQSMYISIFGPREMRIREKAKGEYAKIELFTKFSLELPQNLQESINKKIKKFAKDIILRTSYPRCQITINMNIFNTSCIIDKYSLIPKICNGLMMALCISGINLKMLCLAKGFLDNNKERCMIFMEVKDLNDEDNIYDFDSDNPLDINTYVELVNKTKSSIKNMDKKLKNFIYTKFIKQ